MADDVDEALEESFPASDPPANTVETGIGVNGDPLAEGTATEDTETTETGPTGITGTERTETTDRQRETE
jgi:hypothetical protein